MAKKQPKPVAEAVKPEVELAPAALPAEPPEAPAEPAAPPEEVKAPRRFRVSLTHVPADERYDVVEAAHGDEAVEKWKASRGIGVSDHTAQAVELVGD